MQCLQQTANKTSQQSKYDMQDTVCALSLPSDSQSDNTQHYATAQNVTQQH